MNDKDVLSMTQKELLIRIDERLRQTQESMTEMRQAILLKVDKDEISDMRLVLVQKVNDDEEYKVLRNKVTTLWEDRVRIYALLALVSFVVPLITWGVSNLLK